MSPPKTIRAEPLLPRPWDIVITCDGHRWHDRRYAAGQAQMAKERLEAGYRNGWEFDSGAKQIRRTFSHQPVAPVRIHRGGCVVAGHWSTIEPKSHMETLRYIARPIRELVVDLTDEPSGIDAFFAWQRSDMPVPPEHVHAAPWLIQRLMSIEDVDVSIWQAYVDRWRLNQRWRQTAIVPIEPQPSPRRRPSRRQPKRP